MQLPANTNAAEEAPWVEFPPFRMIDEPLQGVRDYIRNSLLTTTRAAELAPLYEHLNARNGKMVRPGLLLLVGRCLGDIREEHLRVAAMAQMIHDATLLHDDVIDNGHRRRGAPTVNRLWGNESAVLLGDFVLSHVFRMAADLEPAVARTLAQTAVRVCEGELREVMQRRNWQLREEQYIDIITSKSASLFSGCCRLGAMLTEASDDLIEAAAAYGLHAGIAFQIADDLLDILGDEGRMGKEAQSDIDNSKPTLAVIHLLGKTDARDRVRIHGLLQSPTGSKAELVAMLADNGSLQYVREKARHYVARAMESLEMLPQGPAREALAEAARLMADRTM